ncbi:MAG: hypothetical protein PHD61_11595 [Bacteroidales bacterium]|nr:hypothetical protein [Lentimicrobiaceae bacterium]MDD5695932.1 hypothetical protein [Bacteroidales bacterium]
MLKKGELHTLIHKLGLSRIACWLTVLAMFYANLEYGLWRQKERIIVWDVVSYYQYLPALFVHHDISMQFTLQNPDSYKDQFWVQQTENGGLVSRVSMGMSYMYVPFFLSAHLLAKPLGYIADGFSPPYRFALILSCLFYVYFGFWFLRKALLKYFSDKETAFTILTIGLATNLFFYSVIEPAMSHAYSFSLVACLIYLVIKWYTTPKVHYPIFIGLVSGMIVLVRPLNLLFLPLIFLWGVGNWSALRERIRFLLNSWKHLLIILLAAVLVLVPQFLYWHLTTGQFIYYSYGQERFFFHHPHILQGIFGYRKGWLVYTPVMIFSILGVFTTFKRYHSLFIPIILIELVFIYFIFSWWAWWYGGGFGLRAMIDAYALLAFPLTAFTAWALQKKQGIRILYLSLIGTFLSLNVFQTHQYYTGAIHWDAMTRQAYWDSFLRLKPSENFKSLLNHPDYELAKKGIDGLLTSGTLQNPAPDMTDTTGLAAFIKEAEQVIRNDSAWYGLVLQKSASKKMSVEDVIHEEALWIWNKKKDKAVSE